MLARTDLDERIVRLLPGVSDLWADDDWRLLVAVLLMVGLALGVARPFKKKIPCRSERLDALSADKIERIRQQRVKLGAGESRGAFRSVELAVLFHFKPPVY